jgi:hypothetical protein
MSLTYVKPERIFLRNHPQFNEKWLQDRIADDPSILGLGDLILKDRERLHPKAGRLDLLLQDAEANRRYEVEIQLGATDESHIIRTLEYWDIERKRYPQYEHTAVIVAEEITARFFNVIRLLNRAVPLIAVQLNALTVDEAIILHFAKVLDVYQEADVEDEVAGGQVDRRYWDKRASAGSLAALDRIVALVQTSISPPRVTYNTSYAACEYLSLGIRR